jgi:hypothetical protein
MMAPAMLPPPMKATGDWVEGSMRSAMGAV